MRRASSSRTLRLLVTLLGAALLLAGCSGDGGQLGAEPAGDTGASPSEGMAADQDTRSGGENEPPADLTRVRVAVNRNLLFVPVWVADDQGFFEAEGIEAELVELTGGGAELRTAALSGAIDATVQVPEGSALVYQQGQRLVNVVTTQASIPWRLVVSKELEGSVEPGNVSDLEGLTLGVTGRGAGSDVFLQAILRAGGLVPDQDATIAAYGGPWASALTAIEEGQMDGAMILQPGIAASREVAYEFARISDGDILSGADDMPGGTVAMSADYLENNEETARAFTRAIVRAMEYIIQNEEETVDFVSEYTEVERDFIADAVADEIIPAMQPAVTRAGWEALDAMIVEAGVTESSTPYEEVTAPFDDIWETFSP